MNDFSTSSRSRAGDLIPDGSFAKVTMTIRPGGVDGQTEIDQWPAQSPERSPGSDVRMLDCEFTVSEGPLARRKFWQMFTVHGRQGRRERRLDRPGRYPRAPSAP